MRLLGISAFYHDSAAALIEDGHIVAAAQEECFTRKKHDAGFPAHAISYCLEAGKVDLDDIDHVVFFEKPADQIRAAVGDLPRQCTTRVPIVPNGDPALDKRKAFSEAEPREGA
jgi:predicted NodU family carbamoyl transferase